MIIYQWDMWSNFIPLLPGGGELRYFGYYAERYS